MSHLPEHVHQRLGENAARGRFTGKYLDLDAQGTLLAVRCMCCGSEVASMQPVRDKRGQPRMVRVGDKDHAIVALQRHSNWRQVDLVAEKTLEGETEPRRFVCNPIVCADCAPSMNDECGADLWACVMAGWEAECHAARKPEADIGRLLEPFCDCRPVRVSLKEANGAR